MKTIVKFTGIVQWDGEEPIAVYWHGQDSECFSTGLIKRIKYDGAGNVVEIVDVNNTIYRKASGKKRGRPKKEQPSVE